MIYTLTTNPAIDMNLIGNKIALNIVNRTSDAIYSPNGKGINVSLTLKYFNVKSKVLGFFGGFTGKYIIDALSTKQICSEPIWVDDITRINVFINDGDSEYKFVNRGSFVNRYKQEKLLSLLSNLEDCTCLIISGSLPRGINDTYYEEILEILNEKKIPFILDISSEKLKDLLKYKPLLIKPNDEEIKNILGVEINEENDVIKVMEMLKKHGAQNILLTMGDKGAYFSNGKRIFYSSVQKVKLVSSACAGDAALAAFISVWLNNTEYVEEAMKLSAATGANVAESNALGDFSKVGMYRQNIRIREIKCL